MAIATFYNQHMHAEQGLLSSPGLWKARLVMNTVLSDPTCDNIISFNKISRAELLTVHEREYVHDVLALRELNGHGNKRADVLEAVLWQNSSFIEAARHAVEHKTIAFSPTSGFHHAGYAYGGGFCTFNGVMVAARRASIDMGLDVLIIDGDAHFGDGCVDIKDRLNLPVTYYSAARRHNPDMLKGLIKAHRGLVIYQAGADCHEHDTYGAGVYTTEQFIERDKTVFEACREFEVPVVWNLAGGYGAPDMRNTVMLHYSTWKTASSIYC